MGISTPIRLYIVGVLLVLAQVLHAQPTLDESTADLTLDRTSAGIGEPLKATIQLPTDVFYEEIEVTLPEKQQEQVIIEPVSQRDASTLSTSLRILSEGEKKLGPMTLRLKPTGSQNFIEMKTGTFDVAIAPPEGEATMQLADYTAPLSLPFNFLWRNLIYTTGGLVSLGVLLILIILALLLLRRRAKKAAQVPPVPPIEAALSGIRRLKALEVYRNKGVDAHYTELSTVVRRYIEQELHRTALEMTEDEVVNLLQYDLSSIPKTDTLIDVLQRTSMAKFARQAITEDIAEEDCKVAESFFVSEEQRLEALRQEAIARARAAGARSQKERTA